LPTSILLSLYTAQTNVLVPDDAIVRAETNTEHRQSISDAYPKMGATKLKLAQRERERERERERGIWIS